MKPLIIFGTGDIAELEHYYFYSDSHYKVAAFTVDDEYVSNSTFCNLPVIPLSEVKQRFSPEEFDVFIALSYSKLNIVRKEKYLKMKELGYSIASYISTKATILSNKIGENAFILEDNTIQPFVSIGNNVVLWSGNHIGHHSIIRDHTFIASHVVVSGGVDIGEQCFIGVNASLRDHITVGDRCVVGAATLLLSNADPDGVYIGSETLRSKVPSFKLRKI